MKRLATLTIALMLGGAACSGDSASDPDNNGWELGDDAGNNASDAGNNTPNNANNTPANNTPANNPPTNNGPNNTTSNNTTTVNNTTAPTNNATSNNTTGPTNNNTMGNGTGVEGDACAVNSECGGSLTCCQGFDGNATCQPMCFGGGLCGGNDAECAGADEVCCDLSGINQPDSCVGQNFCNQNNPNPGMACTTNADCPMTEVCCLGFDGNGECTTDCFTGGACNDDTECRNGQLCCDINVAKVCFDQCSF